MQEHFDVLHLHIMHRTLVYVTFNWKCRHSISPCCIFQFLLICCK